MERCSGNKVYLNINDVDHDIFIKLLPSLCQSDYSLGYYDGIMSARKFMLEYPRADVTEIVRCKDCKHKPIKVGTEHDFTIEFPDYDCPCQNAEDYYYDYIPPDDWFCANGERKENE